jgi:hypothetical protein
VSLGGAANRGTRTLAELDVPGSSGTVSNIATTGNASAVAQRATAPLLRDWNSVDGRCLSRTRMVVFIAGTCKRTFFSRQC